MHKRCRAVTAQLIIGLISRISGQAASKDVQSITLKYLIAAIYHS